MNGFGGTEVAFGGNKTSYSIIKFEEGVKETTALSAAAAAVDMSLGEEDDDLCSSTTSCLSLLLCVTGEEGVLKYAVVEGSSNVDDINDAEGAVLNGLVQVTFESDEDEVDLTSKVESFSLTTACVMEAT